MIKRSVIVCCSLFTLWGVQAQQPHLDEVLHQIEQNNKVLQANGQQVSAQKLEAKAENNLSNPSLSYAHLWNANDKSQKVGEMVISQSFDFPTLYWSRRSLNALKYKTFDSEATVVRQNILLEAKELCLDIILLRRQKQLLEERLKNATELAAVYDKRLKTGDANVIETNKIKLELLNVKTETTLNATNLQNKLEALRALNGQRPLSFESTEYPSTPFPTDYQQLKSEVISTDRTLDFLTNQSLVSHKAIGLNRSQWLPKFELGYRRNTDAGTSLNGFVVGLSFPLFENRHRVKQAKAQALNSDLQKENATIQLESELAQRYQRAHALYLSMEEYKASFQSATDLNLLKEALTGGQISIIEYFAEVGVIYQSRQNLLALENEYQKTMAQIYKNKL